MFRKTIITVAIAAAAFLALGSPAPASANDFGCLLNPLSCDRGGIIDVGESPDATDAPGGTIVLPQLSPDVLTAMTGPSIDLPEAALPDFDVSGVIVPAPTDEPPADESAAPVDETTTTTATTAPPVSEEPVVESSSFDTEEARVVPTTTVVTAEVEGQTATVQADESALPIAAPGADQDGSFDPVMAAVLGAIGSLAIVLLALTAFTAGRRRN